MAHFTQPLEHLPPAEQNSCCGTVRQMSPIPSPWAELLPQLRMYMTGLSTDCSLRVKAGHPREGVLDSTPGRFRRPLPSASSNAMRPAAPCPHLCALVPSYGDTAGGLTLNLGWPSPEVLHLSPMIMLPSKVLVVTATLGRWADVCILHIERTD